MDSKDILKRVSETLNRKTEDSKREKEQTERERRELVTSIGKDISEALLPYMQMMAEKSQVTKEDIKAALAEVQINIPESKVNIPEFKIPTPQVTVNVPEVKVPQVNIPQSVIKYPDLMKVQMEGVDKLTPLPVMMMDTKGNPMSFSQGSAGGKADFITIKGFLSSIGTVLLNPDGTPVYSSGSALGTVSVSDIFGTIGTNVVNPDGRLKVELPTGSSSLTDTELRASAVPVSQVSGASFSITATDIFATTSTSSVVNPDNRVKVELPATTVTVSSITASSASNIVDSTGVAYSGSNPLPTGLNVSGAPVTTSNPVAIQPPAVGYLAVQVTSSTSSALIDSTGVQYSGSNPVPITVVSGTLTSTVVVGSVVADAVDDGSAPVQSGGIARTANPTAVAGNDVVKSTHDDLGRQVMRPIQVRDLILTAYTSISNGTETTLRSAVAGANLDMTLLILSNNSDAAVTVDVRAATAGNIEMSVVVPPYGTAGYSGAVPWPQSNTGNNWTIDMGDITGTTVYASALFSQEV